jgi:DNA helicase-2/ATP-dependent DNA helicase PcrA
VKDLGIVLFAPDVAAAREAVLKANLFPEEAVRGLNELA